MPIKRFIMRHLPEAYLLPLRYYWRKSRGTLEREMSLLPVLAERGRVAVDVGANVGIYSYALSKLGTVVEAFEPVPWCAHLIEAYGAPNVHVHRVALTSCSGTGDLSIPEFRGGLVATRATLERVDGSAERLSVPLRTLDSFGFEDVALIKIDVEGHELDVLRGAVATMERERPKLIVEIEQRHLSFPMSDVFTFLEALHYEGAFLAHGSLHPLREFTLDQHQVVRPDGPAPRPYVNNFIFTPQESRRS